MTDTFITAAEARQRWGDEIYSDGYPDGPYHFVQMATTDGLWRAVFDCWLNWVGYHRIVDGQMTLGPMNDFEIVERALKQGQETSAGSAALARIKRRALAVAIREEIRRILISGTDIPWPGEDPAPGG